MLVGTNNQTSNIAGNDTIDLVFHNAGFRNRGGIDGHFVDQAVERLLLKQPTADEEVDGMRSATPACQQLRQEVPDRSLKYAIGVARPGFEWAGTNRISRKAAALCS